MHREHSDDNTVHVQAGYTQQRSGGEAITVNVVIPSISLTRVPRPRDPNYSPSATAYETP